MNIRLGTSLGSFILLLVLTAPVLAQENGWPRTLQVKEGSITVYPLQVESMAGDLVRYRAALAYREKDGAEPVFGAGWFVSKVEIDRSANLVHPVNLVVSDTRFPAGTDEVKQELTAAFAQQSEDWDLDFPLTELVSSLETAKQEAQAIENLNTAPPVILYRDHPALLVSFDGDPVLRKIENSNYEAVINTSYPLIYDGNTYFLGAADGVWYSADNATGPYRFETRTPVDIIKMVDAAREAEAGSEPVEKVTAENAPEIVVATTPTELIVTEGPAAFVPLVDDLLVLSNTSDDVFMHISTQQYYVVLAGRWYHSRSLNGPWTYAASDDLPPAFAQIPEESDQAGARTYVAGTAEARDAVLDAQIPQTAAVERGVVDLDVSYDGEPQFEAVEGAEDLSYANNTGSTVLQADRQYYLVENGVWYVSATPNGPWQVSAVRPVQVASISPRSPVYNVKYVYIYDSTPDVVYVGYTPGYVGSYVYYNTIVYGTGWYYRPWISPYYYYPRYRTWGYSVSYNPWYGWGYGLSWGGGPFYAGYYSGGYWHYGQSWYNPYYGYWGPRGYRPRPAHYGRYAYGHRAYGRGDYGRGGYDRSDYGRGDYDRSDYDRGGRNRNQNLYRDEGQRARVSDRLNPARYDDNRNRVAYKDAGPGKGGSKSERVTHSELRVKAQTRDTRFNAPQNNLMASNTVRGKGQAKVSPANGKNSWETVQATNEVRPAKRSAQGNSYSRTAAKADRQPSQTLKTQAPQQQVSKTRAPQGRQGITMPPQKQASKARAPQGQQKRTIAPQQQDSKARAPQGQQTRAIALQQQDSKARALKGQQANAIAPQRQAPKASAPPGQQVMAMPPQRQESKARVSRSQQVKAVAPPGGAGKSSAPVSQAPQASAAGNMAKQDRGMAKAGKPASNGQRSGKRERN